MRRVRAGMTVLALTVACIALAGCADPGPPPAAAVSEAIAIQAEQNRLWWNSISPDVAMPLVYVVSVGSLDEQAELRATCLDDAGVGLSTDQRAWGISGVDEISVAWQQAVWVCAAKFPVIDDRVVVLSEAQLEWVYDYFVQRYEPCVRSLGFTLVDLPDRAEFLESSLGYPAWLPYTESIDPMPVGLGERAALDRACPLPPLVDDLRV